MTPEESERLAEAAAAFLGVPLTADALMGVSSNLRLLRQHLSVLERHYDEAGLS